MRLAFIFLYSLLLSGNFMNKFIYCLHLIHVLITKKTAKSLHTADLNELTKINASIDCISKSSVSIKSSATIYFWDSLSPVIRFAILNQTQVLALSFDIQKAIENDANNLIWI